MAQHALTIGVTDESYSTDFSATENPIVEDGLWDGGATVGLDWNDFRTQNGFAHGKQTLAAHGNNHPGGYNDSVALRRARTGRVWHPNQDVRGRIRIVSRVGWAGFRECQLLTRGTMRGHWLTVYEAIFSVLGGEAYYEWVRFNGLLALTNSDGGYTPLKKVFATGVEDGTYCRATAIGNPPVLRMYTSTNDVDWTLRNEYDTATGNNGQPGGTPDSLILTDGLPGMMHWLNDGSGSGGADTYGWNQFSAQRAA